MRFTARAAQRGAVTSARARRRGRTAIAGLPFGVPDGPQAPGLADGDAAPLAGDDPGPPPRPHATVHALAAEADVEAQLGLVDPDVDHRPRRPCRAVLLGES